jgi:tetratricopeptide (TPR) repeat protein
MKCPECQAQNPEENRFCRDCGTKLLLTCPQCGAEVLQGDKFCGKCGHGLVKVKEVTPIDYAKPQSHAPEFPADKIFTTPSLEREKEARQEAREVKTRSEAVVPKSPMRFVGRSSEEESLKKIYHKVRSGSGQVVELVGEAGMGKSRLLRQFRDTLPQGECTYVEGRCYHYGEFMAYLPILDILRSYFDIKEEDQKHSIQKKMEDKISQLDGRLKSIFAPFQEILSLKVEDDGYLKMDPGQKKEKAFKAIRDLFVRVSQEKPLVLAFEDLHWIDKTSEEFLDYLIGWLENTRILLILLYRPQYAHQWGGESYYTRIILEQLSTKASVELVEAILEGGDVVPEVKEFILSRAGGNCLFIEELTQSLLENGSIQRKEDQYVLIGTASDIQVPDTLQQIIATRINRVEESLKRIMQVASVIGSEFAFRILKYLMGTEEELRSHVLDFEELTFHHEKHFFPELEYVFKHALIQEVAYDSLLDKKRRQIHEKIGRAIEALYSDSLKEYYELLAYHYVRSANTDKALEYLDLSNQKMAKVSAMEEAKAYFDSAMELLDTLPETKPNKQRRINFLVNQRFVFSTLLNSLGYYDLLTRYKSMAIGLDNSKLLGPFYARLGHCEFMFGYLDQAIQTLKKAAELCEVTGNTEDTRIAYTISQLCHFYRGDFDQAIALKEDALHTIDQQSNLRSYVLSLTASSWSYGLLGRWDKAVEEGQKALRAAEECSDDSQISFAANVISLVYNLKGDLGRALEYAQLKAQKARTPVDKVLTQMSLGWAWCRCGDPNRGVEVLAIPVAVFRGERHRPVEIQAMRFLAEGYWLAGEYDKARQTLQELLEIARPCGLRFYIGSAHRILGEVALKTDSDQAAFHFEQSIDVLREIKAENELALAYAGYGRFHKQQGDIAQAREFLTKALKMLERLGTLTEPEEVRETLAELPCN